MTIAATHALLDTLDDHQADASRAIRSAASNVRVSAGAGSGKTRLVAATVAALINLDEVSPTEIVVTTFSRKGKTEMGSRIQPLLSPLDFQQLHLGTFHSLAAKWMGAEDDRFRFKYCVDADKRDMAIPDKFGLWRAIVDWGPPDGKVPGLEDVRSMGIEAKIKDYTSTYDFLRSRGIQLGANVATVLRETGLKNEKDLPEKFMKAWEVYEASKAALNAFDFNDLLWAWKHSLERDAHRGVPANMRFVIVDEAQDNDVVQLEIARLLARAGTLALVGDGRQAIYSWRGAAPEVFLGSDEKLNTTTRSLPTNYRSGTLIVDTGKRVAEGAAWSVGDPIAAGRADLGSVERVVPGPEDGGTSERIGESVAELVEGGIRPGQIAVLVRTNREAGEIEGALCTRGIPVTCLGTKSFWSGTIPQHFLAYAAITEVENMAALERIYNVPKRFLGRVFLEKLRVAWGEHNAAVPALRAAAATMSPRAVKSVLDFAHFLEHLRTLPWDARASRIAEVLKTGVAAPEAGVHDADSDTDTEVVDSCLKAALTHHGAIPFVIFAEKCIANAKFVQVDDTIPNDRVTVATVFRVKGLEWDSVVLSTQFLPHPRSRNVEEERRVLYVGVTRAVNRLLVVGPPGPFDDYLRLPGRVGGKIDTILAPDEDDNVVQFRGRPR